MTISGGDDAGSSNDEEASEGESNLDDDVETTSEGDPDL
jgi:hypothetical protein